MGDASRQDGNDAEVAPFNLTTNVNYLLRRAHSRADQLFDKAMSDLGLTPRQSALLYAVQLCEGGSISALTTLTGMDRGTVSEMVPRLIKRDLLVRQTAQADGRALALYLTERGAELVRLVTERTAELQSSVLEPLPPEYRVLFLKMLSLMVGMEVETRTRVEPGPGRKETENG